MKKIKLLCMGDSLTQGYEIDLQFRWSTLLEQELDIEVVNCGISGDTTAGMLGRFNNAITKYQPSHVIIMGGTNDLWHQLEDRQIISNIMAMTRQARHLDILPVIGIPTVCYFKNIPFETGLFLTPEQLAARVAVFRKKLFNLAVEDGHPYINFSKNMLPDLFLDDGVHPNEKGQKVMMENAKQVLTTLF